MCRPRRRSASRCARERGDSNASESPSGTSPFAAASCMRRMATVRSRCCTRLLASETETRLLSALKSAASLSLIRGDAGGAFGAEAGAEAAASIARQAWVRCAAGTDMANTTAALIGVCPALSTASILAPRSVSSFAHSKKPPRQLACSGVAPSKRALLTRAPAESSRIAQSLWPAAQLT